MCCNLVTIFRFTVLPLSLSTLFPYTTLFRSFAAGLVSTLLSLALNLHGPCSKRDRKRDFVKKLTKFGPADTMRAEGEEHRSEEHTSELQSRQYLVCRLLLEKKKTRANHVTWP